MTQSAQSNHAKLKQKQKKTNTQTRCLLRLLHRSWYSCGEAPAAMAMQRLLPECVSAPADSHCLWRGHGQPDSSWSWLLSSDDQLAVRTTLSGGQSVTLSKSLCLLKTCLTRYTAMKPYPPVQHLAKYGFALTH